jgi:hypothetical protein
MTHLINVVAIRPNRIHKKPRWDRYGVYHRRIAKKWVKRFGTHAGPPRVLVLPDRIAAQLQLIANPRPSLHL